MNTNPQVRTQQSDLPSLNTSLLPGKVSNSFRSRLAAGVVGAASIIGAHPEKADGALMVTGSSDMDYRNLAAQFEGSYLSYKGDYIRAS